MKNVTRECEALKILDKLFKLRDKKYVDFHGKLIPNIPREKIIGVKIPKMRKLAKEYSKSEESKLFLNDLPHKYYDENLLHGIIISEMKDYGECARELDKFLPFVDNWAVCDTISPKVFKNNKEKLIEKIKIWTSSKKTYVCRFGILMLMKHFLDDDFAPEYLETILNIKSDEYYVKMMIAWFFATALSKHWNETIVYLEKEKLDVWIHNKIIQKARESYRITTQQKEYLKSLKR